MFTGSRDLTGGAAPQFFSPAGTGRVFRILQAADRVDLPPAEQGTDVREEWPGVRFQSCPENDKNRAGYPNGVTRPGEAEPLRRFWGRGGDYGQLPHPATPGPAAIPSRNAPARPNTPPAQVRKKHAKQAKKSACCQNQATSTTQVFQNGRNASGFGRNTGSFQVI